MTNLGVQLCEGFVFTWENIDVIEIVTYVGFERFSNAGTNYLLCFGVNRSKTVSNDDNATIGVSVYWLLNSEHTEMGKGNHILQHCVKQPVVYMRLKAALSIAEGDKVCNLASY